MCFGMSLRYKVFNFTIILILQFLVKFTIFPSKLVCDYVGERPRVFCDNNKNYLVLAQLFKDRFQTLHSGSNCSRCFRCSS